MLYPWHPYVHPHMRPHAHQVHLDFSVYAFRSVSQDLEGLGCCCVVVLHSW